MVSTPSSAGRIRAMHTQRKDWDALIDELYASVMSGAPFAIGIASKHKGLLGSSLKVRLNQRFPQTTVLDYVRRNFVLGKLDRLFQSEDGLEREPAGYYKVVGEDLGLPRNCLVSPFENPADSALRGVLLFGGERLEGHLERRLKAAAAVLEGSGRSSPRGGLALESREHMQASLAKINVKRLFEYDMELLARLVNGLEEVKEDLPKELKPIFKSVSDYILKRQLKRGL